MSDPFVAEIRIFPFNFAPKGWAFCDGQLLPISQNTALFSLLGTTYGGDGKSTFALPDLEGSAPMQPGQGQGLSLRDLGQIGGAETVTLLVSEMPVHTHNVATAAGVETEIPHVPIDARGRRHVEGDRARAVHGRNLHLDGSRGRLVRVQGRRGGRSVARRRPRQRRLGCTARVGRRAMLGGPR